MSHFSVVVCIDDPARLETVMEPWSENLETEPYRRYEEGGPAEFWAVKALREHEGLNPDDATLTWAQVAEAHNRRYDDSEKPMLTDEDGRAYTMSTRNPQSKWDWWTIGGRWAGYFVTRQGGRCDQGRKADLDLGALRAVKAAEARETYAQWVKLTDGLPDALPWSVFADNVSEGSGYTIEQAREEYHSQPRIQAVRGTDFQWYDDVIAEFGKPEKLYITQAAARAVPGYATVTLDGRWMAPGRMGWFGCSDDSEGDRIGYWEAANAYIESVPDAAFLVALDCHI
jgi:hypothetical protein